MGSLLLIGLSPTSQSWLPSWFPTLAFGTGQANKRVMIDVPTWTSADGFSGINWEAVSEIDIFHTYMGNDASLYYDGGQWKIPGEIAIAHSHSAQVTLSVGGQGQSTTIIGSILSNPSLRSALVNNLMSQVQQYGYDGIQIDFEDCFNSVGLPSFVQQLYQAGKAVNPNFIIVMSVSDWEQAGGSCSINDFNVPALAPYVTYFDVMFNEPLNGLQNWATLAGSKSKVAQGYDLALADASYHVPTLAELQAIKSAGYTIFFYSSAQPAASGLLYNNIIAAGFGSSSTSTASTSITTASTSATTSFIPTTSSTQSTISTTSRSTTSTTSSTQSTISTTSRSTTSTTSSTTLNTTTIQPGYCTTRCVNWYAFLVNPIIAFFNFFGLRQVYIP